MPALTKRNLFKSVQQSLTRYVEEFRLAEMPDAAHINWDDHANINELPESDCIGLAGVGMTEDEENKFEVVFGIAVSTWKDERLTRMTDMISMLFGDMEAGTRFTLYAASADGLSAEAKSWMVAALPRAVTPVQKAEIRAVQAVECRLLIDPGATSSLR